MRSELITKVLTDPSVRTKAQLPKVAAANAQAYVPWGS